MSRRDSVDHKLWEGLELREKQKLFIIERLSPDCKTDYEAYIKAGYTPGNVQAGRVAVSNLKHTEKIQEGLKRYQNYLLGGAALDVKMDTVTVLKKQASWKPETFFVDEGGIQVPRPLSEISADDQVCIDNIETKAYGSDGLKVTNYKMVDRGKAQDRLIKLLQMGDKASGTEVNVKSEGKIVGMKIIVEG